MTPVKIYDNSLIANGIDQIMNRIIIVTELAIYRHPRLVVLLDFHLIDTLAN